jgi:NAD(P)-dependent dehydrogenase (short-subunit alcohol dehydrogenase family)
VTSKKGQHEIIDLKYTLKNDKDCHNLIQGFLKRAKGLDSLVVLCGGIMGSRHWKDLTEKEWKGDMNLNLDIPFFIAREAMRRMEQKGGRIVLTGTESALHGGGSTSLAYGVAKSVIECLVKALALDGATHNILVNGIRPGFIRSGFHERWQNKSEDDLTKRGQLVPLNRAGYPEEVAALIIYLLSGWAQFITGQMFAITGGDWL